MMVESFSCSKSSCVLVLPSYFCPFSIISHNGSTRARGHEAGIELHPWIRPSLYRRAVRLSVAQWHSGRKHTLEAVEGGSNLNQIWSRECTPESSLAVSGHESLYDIMRMNKFAHCSSYSGWRNKNDYTSILHAIASFVINLVRTNRERGLPYIAINFSIWQ